MMSQFQVPLRWLKPDQKQHRNLGKYNKHLKRKIFSAECNPTCLANYLTLPHTHIANTVTQQQKLCFLCKIACRSQNLSRPILNSELHYPRRVATKFPAIVKYMGIGEKKRIHSFPQCISTKQNVIDPTGIRTMYMYIRILLDKLFTNWINFCAIRCVIYDFRRKNCFFFLSRWNLVCVGIERQL